MPDEDDLDAPEPLLHPVWEDTPDETDADLLGDARASIARTKTIGRRDGWSAGEDLHALLAPLCAAADALARLDARAAVAPDAIRDGLIARMAFAEAAGWLAHTHLWVHPLDLALRDLGLGSPAALAATGAGPRVLPHTFAGGEPSAGSGGSPGSGRSADESRTGWADLAVDEIAASDRAVADALALARLLRRLAGTRTDLFANLAQAEAALRPFGGGPFDAPRFAQWRADCSLAAPPSRRPAGRAGQGALPGLPLLLAAARTATAWMESGIVDLPTPLQATLAAVCLLVRSGPARSVSVPVWAAYPAAGTGDRDVLPALRRDVAARVVGSGARVTWTVVFLHLVAEGARAGLRELDQMEATAEKARGLAANCDRRSRLPDAVEALLRLPALTPKALAARLKITPQTGTALLRELREAGFVREITGRGSCRAFALR